jgi:hypothetical protein
MKRLSISLCAVVCLMLATAAIGLAGPVTYTYNWSPSTNFVLGDTKANQIDFADEGAVTSTGPTDMTASNLTTHNGKSDTITGGVYNLQVHIIDGTHTGDLTVSGKLSGSIINGAPSLVNTFDPLPAALVLGGDTFQITSPSFVAPPPFGAKTVGAIGFHMNVNGQSGTEPPPPVQGVPEPSTMLLSCLGVFGLGFRAWRMRKQAQA